MIQAFVVSRLKEGLGVKALHAVDALAETVYTTQTQEGTETGRTMVASLQVETMEKLGVLMAEKIQDIEGLVYPVVFAVELPSGCAPKETFVPGSMPAN